MTDPNVIHFPLQLQPAASPTGEPAAWFIPGDQPQQWIAEMLSWEVSLVDARLHGVPRSISDNALQGVLVVMTATPLHTLRAIAYQCVGGRLYIPADARLNPHVTAGELEASLRFGINVQHPSAGLIGFEKTDVFSIADLLIADDSRPADWTLATAGVHLNDRIRSVQAEQLPSFEEAIEFGKDDIGSASGDEVPQSPGESPVKDAVNAAATKTMLPLMAALARLLSVGTSNRPRPAKFSKSGKLLPPKEPRQAGKLRRWAMQRVAAMTAELEARRYRELQRLMDLMNRDPDQGLQYALPLNAIAGRGIARPGSRLGPRSTNFSMSGLFRGNKPVDGWHVPPDIRKTLSSQYREAANRELTLERYQRAAYIFAHLLGDYASAASALAKGKYYREAAALYRDRVKNALLAANCLTEGGLLSEAIPLFLELNLFERAGDLYDQLDDRELATDAYHRALQQDKKRNDLLNAALLLEHKLHNPEAAMEVLGSGWPHSDKAELCLKEWFKLSARLGRHDLARRQVEILRQESPPTHRHLPLVKTLSAVATTYPTPEVRAIAADTTRVLAGARLSKGGTDDREALVAAVTSLLPEDMLLGRDGHRFLNRLPKRPAIVPVSNAPKIVRSFKLVDGATWYQAVAISGGFLALGVKHSQLLLIRVTWDGRRTMASADHVDLPNKAYALLPPTNNQPVLLASLGDAATPETPMVLAANDHFGNELTAVKPPITGRSLLGMCRTEDGTTWTLHRADDDGFDLVLSIYEGNRLLTTRWLRLSPDLLEHLSKPVPMAARKGSLYLAIGRSLLKVTGRDKPTSFDLPSVARGLTSSPPATRTRMIITFDEGGIVVPDDGPTRTFGTTLTAPVATFLPDGSLLAAGENEAQLYRHFSDRSAPPQSFETTLRGPLAVFPTSTGEAAILDRLGTVLIYQLRS